MAEERLIIDEYVQIMEHISNKKNFLLSGGAGSGKTYTLVQVIRGLLASYPSANIACITYTNAAVREIKHRVNNNNLHVSTIHDFLWDCIKNFQKEIKISLPNVINSDEYKIKLKDVDECNSDYFFSDEIEKIQYSERLNLSKGIISHDEVLELSHYMFAHYSKLCDIVKCRYPFILIDEYQDTSKLVIEILLNHISPIEKSNNARPCIIGFFGDAMQSIYDDGIGNIDNYLTENGGHVCEVKKPQNRRNPQTIINLANKIRTDRLVQTQSLDINAPNMEGGHIIEGQISFLYSNAEIEYETVRRYVENTYHWDFSDINNTKELNLTHKMIADKVGFPTLMEIFSGDKILDYCYKIRIIAESHLEDADYDNMTLAEVIDFLTEKYGNSVVKPTDSMEDYILHHQELWESAKGYKYSIITKMFVDQDQLIDDKKQDDAERLAGTKTARIIKHLRKIQKIMTLYKDNKLGDFLKEIGRNNISSYDEKKSLKKQMNELCLSASGLLGNIIDKANDLGICSIDDKLQNYIEKNGYVYNRIRQVSYSEFLNYYNYWEDKTPFSTQHKTKGAEYNNVLLLMESQWNKYNFGYMMGEIPTRRSTSYARVVERTRKLFYVCCTRTKKHLVLFYSCPSPIVLDKAKEWFGNDNVIPI